MRPRDVVFAFFSTSWNGAFDRELVMPEDRLAVRADAASRASGGCWSATPTAASRDVPRPGCGDGRGRPSRRARPAGCTGRCGCGAPIPVDPARAVARYEASVRRAADAPGPRAAGRDHRPPAVRRLRALRLGRARSPTTPGTTGPRREPHERWWPAYEEAYRRMRETGRRACAISEAALDGVAPTGPSAVIPNGIEPAEWASPGRAAGLVRGAARGRGCSTSAASTRASTSSSCARSPRRTPRAR